jgi:hypothetical protein
LAEKVAAVAAMPLEQEAAAITAREMVEAKSLREEVTATEATASISFLGEVVTAKS